MYTEDERHDCAYPGCQHSATYSDEQWCFYHEPPESPHSCDADNCAHWKTDRRKHAVR